MAMVLVAASLAKVQEPARKAADAARIRTHAEAFLRCQAQAEAVLERTASHRCPEPPSPGEARLPSTFLASARAEPILPQYPAGHPRASRGEGWVFPCLARRAPAAPSIATDNCRATTTPSTFPPPWELPSCSTPTLRPLADRMRKGWWIPNPSASTCPMVSALRGWWWLVSYVARER